MEYSELLINFYNLLTHPIQIPVFFIKLRQQSNFSMKYRYYILLLSLVSVQLLHAQGKNASEILQLFTYSYDGEEYIITSELTFRPQSGVFENGIALANGISEGRISVYNLYNGELLARKNFGTYSDNNAYTILGVLDSMIYVYHVNPEIGFTALNLKNLSEERLYVNYMLNRQFLSQAKKSSWLNLSKYFTLNPINQKIIVSDSLSQTFETPVSDFVFKNSDYTFETPRRNDLFSSVWQTDKFTFSFSKGKVNYLMQNDTVQVYPEGFINAYFVTEQNILKQYALLKEAAETGRPAKQVKTDLAALQKGQKASQIILQDDRDNFFLAYRENDRNDACLALSAFQIENDRCIQQWSKAINGMYYDIQHAKDERIFKRTFPTYIPSTDFIRIETVGNKILVVYLLQACLLESNTGKILWYRRL